MVSKLSEHGVAGFVLANGSMSTSTTGEGSLEDIRAHDYVLTPGRYVGAAAIEDDGIPFEEKMTEMSQTLYQQMAESTKVAALIRKNLEVLGYGQ